MRLALAIAALIVGLALFPIAYRLHKQHPDWAWNAGPQTVLYVLGTLLLAFGLVGLIVQLRR